MLLPPIQVQVEGTVDPFIARTSLSEVDSRRLGTDNENMETPGRVQNGVIVLEGGAVLPEGTAVTILCDRGRIWTNQEKRNA